MGDNPFSWHKEYYEKSLKQLELFIDQLLLQCDYSLEGWLEWFEKTYPEQYGKYITALQQINALWSKSDPKSMEAFKKAVKVEVDASKWAAAKYLEYLDQQAKEEQLKGTQEALIT